MNPIQTLTSSRLYTLLATSRKARIVSASAVMLTLCAFGATAVAPLAPDAADLPVVSVQETLALPDLSKQITALEKDDPKFIHEERVRSGDSLATLLTRLGVADAAAAAFIKSDKIAHGVMQLKTGKRVQAQTAENGQLLWLRATLVDSKDNPINTILVTRKGDSFVASNVAIVLERRVEMHARNITSTLFAATDGNDNGERLPDSISSQIIEMFSTNINFRSGLKKGDHFNVVYETFWQDGEMVRAGRILAGEFSNRGTTYQSVWFDEPGSKQGGGYYSFDGKSLKKAFLKSPLEFSRVSSGFGMRDHPVSGNWKQHKGVDFAAAVGTPILASGDGVVDSVGTQNGYGNIVVLKHWANYSTAYAHMSRFAAGLHKGEHVKQGEVIGYVGVTGWSTGPHLHYEFRINKEARDPMAVNILAQAPLNAAELSRFRTVSNDMMHRFTLLRPAGVMLAAR